MRRKNAMLFAFLSPLLVLQRNHKLVVPYTTFGGTLEASDVQSLSLKVELHRRRRALFAAAVDADALGRSLNAGNRHVGEWVGVHVGSLDLGRQAILREVERDCLGRLLLDTQAVVQEELTLGTCSLVQGHDETPGILPRGSSRVACLLGRDDVSSSDVNGLMQQRGVESLVLASSDVYFGEVVPVVPDRAIGDTGEDTIHSGGQWCEHRRDQKSWTRHKLRLDGSE